MTLSVGIDLVSFDEVTDAVQLHGDRYLQRVYTDLEQRECGRRIEWLAAGFAAKEATMKALGRNDEPIPWLSISVSRGDGDGPSVTLSGAAAALAEQQGVRELSLSIALGRSSVAAIALARV